MKVGGQILWNARPICETSQTCCLMGRRPMKDVLGSFWRTCCSFWFIGWVSPCNCEGSVKNPSIWKESFTWIVPRIRPLYAEEFGRVTYWSQTLRSWKRWTHRKSTRKDSMRKRWYFPKKENFFFQSQMDENPRRRSGTENIHLDAAATKSRRGSHWLSWRIRRVSSTTSWLISGCRWSCERFLVHVGKFHIPPSRWTPSQTLLAERRIIPYESPLPTEVTIDQGNLIRGVIKSWDKKFSTSVIWCTSIGLRISGHDAAEVYSPEEHWHAEANLACKVHEGYCASY